MSVTVEIVRTPDVLHGKPRIEGTRVGVFQVGTLVREAGLSPEEAASELGLTEQQVSAALDYYDDHPDEMATLRAQREATRQQIEAQSRAPE